MPVACSEDLQQRIVWQSVYQEANPDEIAVSLYVCERTVRRIVSHFLATEHVTSRVNIGRPRALTSLEETLTLNVIFENPGIYLDKVQRYLEKKPGMVVSISTMYRTTQRLGLTRRKIRHLVCQGLRQSEQLFRFEWKTVTLLTSYCWTKTVCKEWDKAELIIRGYALVSQKLMGQRKRFSALAY